jgi:hypothetical protein
LGAAVSVIAAPCPASSARIYARREPEKTALHLVVREHLETFLATVREERGKELPRYVEEELRRYLRCGILAHGFLRVVCRTCRKEFLVANSCKCRGACPSCCARRMCGTAAHLVDHVLPNVPVRQWVLTAPHEVRRVLALRPDALTACGRLFVEEIARWQKQAAKARGTWGGQTGAVTFVQRFNSLLGSFVHFHVVVPDGVFLRDGGGVVTFHEGPAPSREDIAAVAARLEARMTQWLRRRGQVDERPAEERSNEALDPSPLEACMQMSLYGGTFLRLASDGTPVPFDEERFGTGTKSPWAAEVAGFNVHAGVTVRAGDREGLERLLRYCARPPFSLERLSILSDGRVAYQLRKPRRNGATHLVLEPIAFLGRIASLIPPPRFPLLRLSGVFAPSSPWRASVVPHGAVQQVSSTAPAKARTSKTNTSRQAASSICAGDGRVRYEQGRSSDDTIASGPRTSLGAGVAKPVGARIDWASLVRRTYLEDVLSCPCGGRRFIVADITERDVATAILGHLGLPTQPPPIARARSPGGFDAA